MQHKNLINPQLNEAESADNDDRQIGRILSRREVLALLGASGAALLAGCSLGQATSTQPTNVTTPAPSSILTEASSGVAATSVPACVVRPEVTEGPYYIDEDLDRSDIRSDTGNGAIKDGIPLILTFNVSQVGGNSCTPLEGAKVEIWHCDAAGIYSDVQDPGFNTSGQNFLRGYQMTDANGKATFTTIYPGWYSSRAVHIHFKVHPTSNSVFTSQLFFDDSLSDQVYSNAPYASKGQRDILNSTDNIYQDTLLLTVTETDQGYVAVFDIGVQTA